jgi:solute carrier family 50 protein (sugar transporter)
MDKVNDILHTKEQRNPWIDILGTAGMFVSFIMLVSPLPSVLEGLRKMEFKSLSQSYLICAMGNSILWAVYGFKLNEFAMYLTNTFAFLLFLFYYNSTLWINSQGNRILPSSLFSFIVSYAFYTYFPKEMVGFLAFLMSSIWMLSSIEKMREAILERSAKFINLPVVLSSMTGNLIWVIYGTLLSNFYIIFPNTLGLVLYLFNIIIYFWVMNYLSEKNGIITVLKTAFLVREDKQRIPMNSIK